MNESARSLTPPIDNRANFFAYQEVFNTVQKIAQKYEVHHLEEVKFYMENSGMEKPDNISTKLKEIKAFFGDKVSDQSLIYFVFKAIQIRKNAETYKVNNTSKDPLQGVTPAQKKIVTPEIDPKLLVQIKKNITNCNDLDKLLELRRNPRSLFETLNIDETNHLAYQSKTKQIISSKIKQLNALKFQNSENNRKNPLLEKQDIVESKIKELRQKDQDFDKLFIKLDSLEVFINKLSEHYDAQNKLFSDKEMVYMYTKLKHSINPAKYIIRRCVEEVIKNKNTDDIEVLDANMSAVRDLLISVVELILDKLNTVNETKYDDFVSNIRTLFVIIPEKQRPLHVDDISTDVAKFKSNTLHALAAMLYIAEVLVERAVLYKQQQNYNESLGYC